MKRPVETNRGRERHDRLLKQQTPESLELLATRTRELIKAHRVYSQVHVDRTDCLSPAVRAPPVLTAGSGLH